MLISVIVPVYNVEKHLPRCVDSILAQKEVELELILVDDGSTDGSGAVCNGYAARDGRVCVIHQRNAGVSAARNAGIERARGDFIGFADSDDEIADDMYAYLLGLALQNGADMAACQYSEVDADGAVTMTKGDALPPDVLTREEAVLESIRVGRMGNSACTKLFRREILPRFRPEFRFGEDAVFVYMACAALGRAVIGGASKYRYYCGREGNASTSDALRNNECDIARAEWVLAQVRRDFPQYEAYQSGLCAFMYTRNFIYSARAGLDKPSAKLKAARVRAHRKNLRLCPSAGRNFRLAARVIAWFPGLARRVLKS